MCYLCMVGIDLIDLDAMHQSVRQCREDNDSWAIGEFDFEFVKEVAPEKKGYSCKKCKELFPFAEPNQSDGTLICYSCRKYG